MFDPKTFTTKVKDRSITYRFPVEVVSDTVSRVIDLNIFHYAGRGFTASVAPVTLTKRDGYVMESFMMFSSKHLGGRSVARFSAKKMAEFGQDMLAEFQANWDHPSYAEIMSTPAVV